MLPNVSPQLFPALNTHCPAFICVLQIPKIFPTDLVQNLHLRAADPQTISHRSCPEPAKEHPAPEEGGGAGAGSDPLQGFQEGA